MKDVRQQILDASLDLLREQGLAGLSMREVARRAGVSHQAPYHHFADREAILAELVRAGFDTLRGYLMESTRFPVGDRSTAMGRAYVRFAREQPEVFRLMFRGELTNLERFPATKQSAEATFDLVASAIAEAEALPPSREIARIIACWSLVHGLASLLIDGRLLRHLGEPGPEQDRMIHAVIEELAPSLRRPAHT